MLPPVYNTLRASSAVVRLVDDRIFRNTAPQGTQAPYVTWFLVTGTPENHLSGLPSMDRMTIQLDCWGAQDEGDDGSEALATAVRDALEPYGHMTAQPIDARDPVTKLWRMALEFDWFVARPTPEPTS